ncbi:unnamed protein product [Pleuronectes platessa]|uniref:Uncharacterized protein n=1 Tax=Pleuronectes platessa TaxID=8262 RepID=A0A9N7YCX9_PLEPL|nr:unnamed protein product [Pleuronectes platessa]
MAFHQTLTLRNGQTVALLSHFATPISEYSRIRPLTIRCSGPNKRRKRNCGLTGGEKCMSGVNSQAATGLRMGLPRFRLRCKPGDPSSAATSDLVQHHHAMPTPHRIRHYHYDQPARYRIRHTGSTIATSDAMVWQLDLRMIRHRKSGEGEQVSNMY